MNQIKDTTNTTQIFNEYPDIVSVEQVMSMIRVGKSSTYNLLKLNRIRHVRVGKKYIIPKNAVVDFVCHNGYNESG